MKDPYKTVEITSGLRARSASLSIININTHLGARSIIYHVAQYFMQILSGKVIRLSTPNAPLYASEAIHYKYNQSMSGLLTCSRTGHADNERQIDPSARSHNTQRNIQCDSYHVAG